MVARTWWVLVILALMMALPALAQVTVLKSGTVIPASPSTNTPEHRAPQAAAMKGAMSGRYLGMPPAHVRGGQLGTGGAAPDRP
jgi:hypothetical protein